MIKSMTGYGRGSIEENGREFTIELKSVNNRYLDINIKLPRHLSALEDRVRKYITSKVSRGKIDVFINQVKFSDKDISVCVDEQIASSYYNAFKQLKKSFSLPDDVTLSLLTRYQDVISIEKHEDDFDEVWSSLSKALAEAVDMFIDMRHEEGLKLSKDISDRGDILYSLTTDIEVQSPKIVQDFREKISARVSDYLKDVEIDEAKLLNEVAFFADKINVTEEIVRLKSHISQLKSTLNSEEPIGRKLDFLIQEMNREVNTIGSKSNDLIITNTVVDLKCELEKIREQIQNLE